ncbi:MAG: LysM peptidoglycan-binding domain-containing protein [Desulfobulbaceae bacterium]|nr:LysM peptidoglycan-binding domain-containing protein [Desulfobulbaceae bacterium]
MDFPFPHKQFAHLIAALAISALLFSGCARTDSNPELSTTDPAPPLSDDGDVKKIAPLASLEVEDDLQPSEGEIGIEEEIKELNESGTWGKQDKEPPTMVDGFDKSKYDFPVVLNNQVSAYLKLFQGEQHDMFERWLARSTKYLPMIKRELTRAKLPTDLAYLSMIESGYTPTAKSSAGAVGLWQFMRETGRQYTLLIDDYIDERRHIEKSTKAAVNMLGDLYRDFGDWHLAVAAYNGGPARVQNGLSRFDAKDFWELANEQYLPLETKRYVPKLIAAIIIAKDPKKYGFNDISYQPEFNSDRLTVKAGLPLDAVALVSGCDVATIKSLNPELHRGVIPPNCGRYLVRIPAGKKDLANRNLALLRAVRDTKYRRHVVKRRESMTTVCRNYGVSRTALLKVNNLRSARLTPGRTLLIPYTVTSYALGNKSTSVDDKQMIATAPSPANDTTTTHTVAKGDTLVGIARQYGMSQRQLLALNRSASAKKLRLGQKLKVNQPEQTTMVAQISAEPQASKKIIRQENVKTVATSKQTDDKVNIIATLKADKSKTVIAARETKSERGPSKFARYSHDADWYLVKNGETIWSIAKKHKVSTNQIKKWNNLKSNDIHAGLRLRVSEA